VTADLFETFADPPREFGMIPFWFWNDDLHEDELISQLRAFHKAGFGGVLPHARVGLSRRVGYLTDEFFRLLRLVVEEAARLGMKVILYDEASYPSGSARGMVVAQNPAYASQIIRLWEKEIEGPFEGFCRPNTGRALLDRHISTVLGRIVGDGAIDPESLRLLTPHTHTVFKIDVPAGRWKVMSVWSGASGGTIRGAFADEEDGHATAPASGDILNPEAVACFIRLTHDRYYEELKDHFGTTIIAMFTDEPSTTGRGARRGPVAPYTSGFDEWLEQRWGEDPRSWLPALWLDFGEGTQSFRQKYDKAIQARLHEVFYDAQRTWCEEHEIALTGHPHDSNDLTSLRQFHVPGQDMVWRYVEPGKPTALQGKHSVAAKCATSGARLNNRQRVLTEVFGAYGWRLTLDEVKWLLDWHIVRGNNLINPHAAFYSIRDRRAWESEPDLTIHNVWWPYFDKMATYARRLCWLLSDGEQICDVAILGDGHNLPWRAAAQLYERQIDFLYLDDRAVAEASIDDGRLVVGAQSYRVVVIDALSELTHEARQRLDDFAAAGGKVIDFRDEMPLAVQIDQAVPRDIRLSPAHTNLRFIHYRKEGLDLYLLVNEGEETVTGDLELSISGKIEIWDALSGASRAARGRITDAGIVVGVELERRQSLVVAIDPSGHLEDAQGDAQSEDEPEETTYAVETAWALCDPVGAAVNLEGLGDWSQREGWELFSGTLSYRNRVSIPEADEVWLDLGRVGDIAEVLVDGSSVGVRMWPPYRLNLGSVDAGDHTLEIRVTNSMANEYEGMQLPSGLMGPVALVGRTRTGGVHAT
jgi:hypothetical protein